MIPSWALSVWLFDVADVTFSSAMLSGILSGVCLMLYVCFHLALGTATGRAGMSAAVCITASLLLPGIFAGLGTYEMFNPLTLDLLAVAALSSEAIPFSELLDFAITIAFALAIMAITYLIALFAQNAKRVDNTGDEPEL